MTEQFEVGSRWEWPGWSERTIEAVHRNNDGTTSGEDVIVYRVPSGDLGYDRRFSFAAHAVKVEPKWEAGKVYRFGPSNSRFHVEFVSPVTGNAHGYRTWTDEPKAQPLPTMRGAVTVTGWTEVDQ